MFNLHPSERLRRAFIDKPFQGALPEASRFLFIGLDANYDPDIELSPVFPQILEYHKDGPAFWRKYGVHHPFLLPGYRGDGRFYHRSFARIGFQPAHAGQVSFIELLHVPTTGRNRIALTDLDSDHLVRIAHVIEMGTPEHIFVPSGVARLMIASKRYPWLKKRAIDNEGGLNVFARIGSKTVYGHLHLSVYGKFEVRKVEEAEAIGRLIG